eukprot:7331715-Pyramimonas_sp.AAC.1
MNSNESCRTCAPFGFHSASVRRASTEAHTDAIGGWDRDTDTVELTIKTLFNHLVTGEFGPPANSLRMPYVRVEPQSADEFSALRTAGEARRSSPGIFRGAALQPGNIPGIFREYSEARHSSPGIFRGVALQPGNIPGIFQGALLQPGNIPGIFRECSKVLHSSPEYSEVRHSSPGIFRGYSRNIPRLHSGSEGHGSEAKSSLGALNF